MDYASIVELSILYYVATTWTVLQWTHNPLLVGTTNTLLMVPMCISFLFDTKKQLVPILNTVTLGLVEEFSLKV
jgi:hypothetical protein